MLVDPEPPTLVALTNSADPSMLVSAKVTEGLLSYSFDLEPKPQHAGRSAPTAESLHSSSEKGCAGTTALSSRPATSRFPLLF